MFHPDSGYIYEVLRRIGTALLTPIRFSVSSGHFRSSIARRALDPVGNCIPWYTYPAIEFLSNVDFTTQSILEFGGGNSTVWWAERAHHVVSVENNADWFKFIGGKVNQKPNVEFFLCEDPNDYANQGLGRKFDVIVIDGGDRLLCARNSLSRLEEGGVVILDDSEGYWGKETEKTYPIMELFADAGFMRVDFYGFAPGVIKPHSTSFFFKDRARIFTRLMPPVRTH